MRYKAIQKDRPKSTSNIVHFPQPESRPREMPDRIHIEQWLMPAGSEDFVFQRVEGLGEVYILTDGITTWSIAKVAA